MVKSLLQGSGLIKPVQSTSAPDTSGLSLEMYNAQKQQWQEQLSQKRDAIIRKGKADGLDTNQVNKHLDQLYANARVKALDIKLRFAKLNKPEAPDAMTQRLQAISRVGKDYGRSPEEVAEAIARTKIGSAGASVFFPKPKEPETRRKILESQRADIDRRLKDFAVTPSTEGRGRLGWFGPKKTKKPMEIMVFDPSLYGTDKDGRVIQGSWRKASDLEAEERRFLYTSRARNWAEERMLGGGPMSSHYKAAIVSPRTGGGAVGDQALAYLNKKTESGPRQLDEGVAMSIMQEAGGDADKARQIARSRGYNF